MKYLLPCMLMLAVSGYPQGSPPWEHPLKLAWSGDGTTFASATLFQDSAGVPSVIRWKGDTLVGVFQWFRKPVNSLTWDRVAVKFSYNAGSTWTAPVPIAISGFPSNYQRPFDPTLAVVNSGSLRVYFSSSDGMPMGGQDATINTYSAVGSNGINFTFEPNARFDHPTNRVIDPAVINFNGVWHYLAPAGAPQDGAFHATGSNGLDFVQQNNIASDATHNWTGNFMVNGPGELRFYGSGQRIWYNSSTDGNNWQGYANTNINGGDPAVVKVSASQYLAVFVGEHYITGIENLQEEVLSVSPNPFTNFFRVFGSEAGYDYWLSDITGRLVKSGRNARDQNITTDEMGCGLFILNVKTEKSMAVFKLIKFVP